MTFSSLALTACNGGTSVDGKPGNGARTTKDLTNVYKADSVSTVGTLFENLQINQVYKMNDGKLLVCGYTTEDYEDKYYITDIDFKNASEMTIKKAEGQNSDTYIQNVTVNPTDGSIWYVKNVYTYSGNPGGDISIDDMEKYATTAVIGGADGPTAILTASKLAVELLPAIAIAAYSYMALIPMIQPPLMKLMTTKKMRQVKMSQLRVVSKTEKIIFPIAVTIFVVLLIPDTAPLIGMLMLGNLFRECGVTERLSDTAQNALINIVTIPLGLSVGFKATASSFLTVETLSIIALGLTAFLLSTAGGLLLGDLMYVLTGGKVNPLIGSAGVSAVPMAARVSQVVGQKENPSNFLLMHAMGPNVAGVIGSACAAGFMIKVFGG